jgi:hypothetical protein
MARGINLYLQDIVDSIEKIEQYTSNLFFDAFAKDRKTMDAVVRNLEIIGEAAKNIPENTKTQHPNIPWQEMIGMRNKVIHEYFGISAEILWETIKNDIPLLKASIAALRNKI